MPETLYSISDTTLTGLANAVRSQTGSTSSLSPSDMIDEVSDLLTYSITAQSLGVSPTVKNDFSGNYGFVVWQFIVSVKTNYDDFVTDNNITYKCYIDDNLISQGLCNITYNDQPIERFSSGMFSLDLPFEAFEVIGDSESDRAQVNIRFEFVIHKGANTFNVSCSTSSVPETSEYIRTNYPSTYPNQTLLWSKSDVQQHLSDIDNYITNGWLATWEQLVQE